MAKPDNTVVSLKREQAAAAIAEAWHNARERVIEVGRRLLDAKAALPHGDFGAMVERDLPFTRSTAFRLMAVAKDSKLANVAHAQHLPLDWTTLYELTKVDDAAFARALDENRIRPDMTRSDVGRIRQDALVAAENDRRRDDAAATGFSDGEDVAVGLARLTAEGRKFKTIIADPPWHYETWSDKGQDRSPSKHYDTMPLDEILGLPVADVAAPDAVLLLWSMDWLFKDAFDLGLAVQDGGPVIWIPGWCAVMAAWGFKPVTKGFVWIKGDDDGLRAGGTGHWTRANPEDCWFGTRGKPKRLAKDVDQALLAPATEHSAKPEEIQDRVERLLEGPYLELFGRRRRERWTVLGNQVPAADAAGDGSAEADSLAGVASAEPAPQPGEDYDPETGEIYDSSAAGDEDLVASAPAHVKAAVAAGSDFVGDADPAALDIPAGLRRAAPAKRSLFEQVTRPQMSVSTDAASAEEITEGADRPSTKPESD